MTRPGSTVRLFLAALLLGASVPARADAPEVSAPLKPADQVKNACDAEAVAVRLLDSDAPRNEGDPAPGPSPKRAKDAQNTANRLGAGVESESDNAGQTLSWKRSGTPKQCRAKLHRLQNDFPGRVTFEPTTEERVADVRRRRDAMIPEGMRKDASDPLNGKLFDGTGTLLGGLFEPEKTDAVAARLPTAAADIRPVSYESRQLPVQYQGPLTRPVPEVQTYSPPTFGQRLVNAYASSKAYVASSLDEAGRYVTGVARSVRNYFYSGIEMIQGFGYKLIHAGRQTNWGTKPLVDGLRKIAAYMRGGGRADTDLAIGDISSANGGQLGGHASHQTGRDVDIGFYMTDENGKAVDAQGFVRFTSGRDGLTGSDGGRKVRFDAQRNWFLVQAILANDDPHFKPTHIFIANHLKTAILAAAGDSPERGRAAGLMSYWPGHDNHLHLRVE